MVASEQKWVRLPVELCYRNRVDHIAGLIARHHVLIAAFSPDAVVVDEVGDCGPGCRSAAVRVVRDVAKRPH